MEFKTIRKKPVEVKGIELTEQMLEDDFEFSLKGRKVSIEKFGMANKRFVVETLEGNMRCNVGDWLIIGVEGELYPCRKDIFEKTYDIVDLSFLTPRKGEN